VTPWRHRTRDRAASAPTRRRAAQYGRRNAGHAHVTRLGADRRSLAPGAGGRTALPGALCGRQAGRPVRPPHARIRNYGVHPRQATDGDIGVHFTEDKCGLLFLEAHRHLKHLAEVTALAVPAV
jgi:hypothetical protein